MGRRATLTDAGVANLKPRAQRYAFADPELGGHYIRVTPTGAKSYAAVSKDPASGKQVWATIGPVDLMKLEEARDKARQALRRIKSGLPPFDEPPVKPETFDDVSRNWLKRHVEAKGLRSRPEIERLIERYVSPEWKSRGYAQIRRGDVTRLLDKIEDENGPSQANAVLSIIRGIANWYATRHEDYISPFVKGMRRAPPTKRERTLADEEVRTVWGVAEKEGTFGAIVRLALLTAQRREKIATMKWRDLADGAWTVARAEREKGTGDLLPLPAAAVAIIEEQPKIGDSPYVFTGRTGGHFNGFSPCKRRFDAKMPADFAPWTVHDLRRTARSLMSRAGVRPEIAERVLGHAIAGVEGVYDRHSYKAEKGDALAKLAGLIAEILRPADDKVVRLQRAGQ